MIFQVIGADKKVEQLIVHGDTKMLTLTRNDFGAMAHHHDLLHVVNGQFVKLGAPGGWGAFWEAAGSEDLSFDLLSYRDQPQTPRTCTSLQPSQIDPRLHVTHMQ